MILTFFIVEPFFFSYLHIVAGKHLKPWMLSRPSQSLSRYVSQHLCMYPRIYCSFAKSVTEQHDEVFICNCTSSNVKWQCLPLFLATSTNGLPISLKSIKIWQIRHVLTSKIPIVISIGRTFCIQMIAQQRYLDTFLPFVMGAGGIRAMVQCGKQSRQIMNNTDSHNLQLWHQFMSPSPV